MPPGRALHGFAPSTDLYKVDKADHRYGQEPEIEVPVEPVILPGESLSKYRAPSETQSAASSPAPKAPPADDFVAQGWDGGFVLPGETLRPRSTPPTFHDQAQREPRGGERDRSRGRDERDQRGPRDDRRPRQNFERPQAETIEQPLATGTVTHESEPSSAESPSSFVEPVPAFASHQVMPLHSTFVPPPPMPEEIPASPAGPEAASVAMEQVAVPEPVPAPAHEVVEPPPMVEETAPEARPEPVAEVSFDTPAEPAAAQEYEPSEASASYRVDPVPPREFRQSSPVLDEPPATEAEAENAAEAEFVQAVEVAPAQHQDVAPESHELTSISDTGNMHSEPAAYSHHELPQQEEPEPASPIAHEAAVVDAAPAGAYSAAALFFEPGSGHLEEETLDEEDDFSPVPSLLAANSELDQQEQETLENAADLGTMIREMSIDQITRVEPALEGDEEEDDFEEDFLESDQDFHPTSTDEDEDEDEDAESEDEDSEDEAPYAEAGDEAALGDLAEPRGSFADADRGAHAEGGARETYRDGAARRDPRRDGRRGDRNRRPATGDRDRSSGSPDRPSNGDRGQRDPRRGRQSMQSTNLPAISDLLKPGQEILVQIAKEPIAKKGARITSHIALPGRFLVFMPTVSHTGVSRKIESDGERRRLKEILLSERGDAQGGFIVRTAAAGASEEELRSDLRFLLNLWSDIKARSESSKSPALIYHDLNLIERVLRDQVTDNFSAIWVDSETEYERVLRFLQRFQPSLIRRVKLYTKETPLFEQFGITEEINKALRSKVWLKSGGSIVINQTEALVAIDINTGKFVGKTARLEDTIVKTNLDAIPEIVRQIRLRDLGGIIIIDFIDMDERKNRNKVMAALEEELKLDRAPSKVLQFNDFGLVAITRKRVKQSLERTLSTTCGICQGTGMVKSPVTICNDIYVEMRKMAKHLDRGDVMLRVHPDVVKQLKAPNTHWLQEMEEMVGKTILIKSDPVLHPEQFDIH
jgi:ribonuclease G